MFIHKHIVGFFILQNIVSLFCVRVYPESVGSDYISEPEDLKSIHNIDEFSKVNVYKNIVEHNEHSERNSNENWATYSNENRKSSNECLNKNSENNPNENAENNDENENVLLFSELSSENNLKELCPEEDYSIISYSDIQYLIEEKAEILKIKEKIVNSFYTDSEEVFKKYMGELEEFQERFQERPTHMRHVLHDMANLRQKLKSNVDVIANQLEQFHTLAEKFYVVNESSYFLITQLEQLRKICKINRKEIGVDNRFGPEINDTLTIGTGMYCIRLKDLNDYINIKLTELQSEYEEGLNGTLENRDEMYEQKLTKFKINLKEAAVKQFGMTMYEVISLQDDYNHFIKDLEHANITSEIYSLMETTAEISYKQIGLKRDLEKYRKHCIETGNQRLKRNVFDYLKGSTLQYVAESTDIPMGKLKDSEADSNVSVDVAVNKLIKAKIDEIKEDIERNYTTMFAKLETIFNDPNVIDSYVKDLHDIQIEIGNDIKEEQEGLNSLRNLIPEKLINKVPVLSKKSKELLQIMDSTKLFFDHTEF